MKGFIKLIIVIVVLGGLWFAWEQWKGNDTVQVVYQTEPLEKGNLMITIDATGVTEPDELVDVGAQVSGIIMEFGKDMDGKIVDYSSPVKAGQMLAEIDKLPVQLDVQRAEATKAQAIAGIARAKADIQQAKAKHNQAKLDRERAEKIGPGDALSKSSYDQYIADEETARANVSVAEASLQEAEASLKQAEAALKKEMRNLEYTTILSPVDGVVVKRLVNIGQTVVSSMSASSLFYIATDLSKLKIWAAVNEADIGSIRKGQNVVFTVDAFPGRKFKGTVDKIRLDATMTSNVVTYIVDIDVPNPDKLLIPYLTANVQFVVEDIKDAYLVSNSTLRFQPEMDLVNAEQKTAFERMLPELIPPTQNGQKKKAIVWEQKNNTLIPHLVTKGESNGMLTAISGETLYDGMKIVSSAQIFNGTTAPENEESATAGGENPFAPKMPPRRKPSAGNVKAPTNTPKNDGPPPPP